MPTCVFQGTINLPIFQSSFSITDSTVVGRNGVNGISLNATCSDFATAAMGILSSRPGGSPAFNTPTVLNRGTFLRITALGATNMKIGGGYSAPSGNEVTASALDGWGMLTADGEQYIYAGGGSQNVYITTPSIRPFVSNNFTSPNFYYGPQSGIGSVGLTDYGNQSLGGVGSGAGRALIRYIPTATYTGSYLKGYLRSYNWGSQYVSVASIPAYYPNIANWPEFNNWNVWPGSINNPYTVFYIPNYGDATNFAWLISGNVGNWTWYVSNLTINYPDVNGGFTYIATMPSALSFDSSALNNANANFGASMWTCCANGLIYSIPAGWSPDGIAHDYFVSKDGKKYWLLNYMPQGAYTINPGAVDGPTSRYIDAQGIFWYTGAGAITAGSGTGATVTPLYSLGFNLTYTPLNLPSYPPFKLPCWAPCLNGAAPLSKVI